MSTALLQKNIDHLASLRSKLLRVEKRKRFVAEQSRLLLLQAKELAHNAREVVELKAALEAQISTAASAATSSPPPMLPSTLVVIKPSSSLPPKKRYKASVVTWAPSLTQTMII
jgi:hypothetical protein